MEQPLSISSLAPPKFLSIFRELFSSLFKIVIRVACRSSFIAFSFDFSEGVGLPVKISPCKSSGRFVMLDLSVSEAVFALIPIQRFDPSFAFLAYKIRIPPGVPKLCSGRNVVNGRSWLEHTTPRGVGTLVDCQVLASFVGLQEEDRVNSEMCLCRAVRLAIKTNLSAEACHCHLSMADVN
ncbi:hypothetical protein ACFX13_004081 [Malus domestica]